MNVPQTMAATLVTLVAATLPGQENAPESPGLAATRRHMGQRYLEFLDRNFSGVKLTDDQWKGVDLVREQIGEAAATADLTAADVEAINVKLTHESLSRLSQVLD